MTLHLALVVAAWLMVGYALCVLGDTERDDAPPPNNRPVYLIPNDPEEEL